MLVLCGDLTDYGLPEEALVLNRELSAAGKVPVVAVFGNHDLESGNAAEITAILTDAGVRVLDGDGVEIQGVGFAGVKGLAGGFGCSGRSGRRRDEAVRPAVDEALKLEAALARLTTNNASRCCTMRPSATRWPPSRGDHPFLGSSASSPSTATT